MLNFILVFYCRYLPPCNLYFLIVNEKQLLFYFSAYTSRNHSGHLLLYFPSKNPVVRNQHILTEDAT